MLIEDIVDESRGGGWRIVMLSKEDELMGGKAKERSQLSGTWIFHTFQTFTFTRLTFISPHDL